jgi:hypothetical protein
MKILLAVVVSALVFGAGGFAASCYWQKQGATYFCHGVQGYVICKTEGWTPRYGVLIDKEVIDIFFGKRAIFSCEVARRPYECWDFR